MQKLMVHIKSGTGLHARPASLLVGFVSKYQSTIVIGKGSKTANLKSILALLSLAIAKDDAVTIQIQGEDEAQAVAELDHFGKENGLW
jgi:phosphocarrier protein HPr